MKRLGSMAWPARMESLIPSLSFVKACTEKSGFHKKRAGEIELCLEEILVNIIHYAYPDTPGEMDIACELTEDDTLIIEVTDRGIPFDLLSVEKPDITANMDERNIGGLGIFFVKELMDDVQYHRENDKNILKLFIKKSAAKEDS